MTLRRVALLAGIAMALPQAVLADTLLDNIQGTTIDSAGKFSHFSALVIDGDGKITKVLSRKDKRPKKPDYLIDGKGRFVLPGIIESHVRLMPLALSLLAPDAGGTMPVPRPEDRDVAFGKVQRLLAARGITAVADMGTSIEDWQTYRRAGDNGTLHLRIMAYAADIPSMALIAGPRPTPWLYQDRLRLNGLHLDLGSPPAAGFSDTQLRNVLSRAAMDGFQLAVSAPDSRQVSSAIGAYSELFVTYRGERRWRIEQVSSARVAELAADGLGGTIFSTCPARLAQDRPAAGSRQMDDSVHPWQSLVRQGARLVFASCGAGGAASPLAAMAAAISREDGRGEPPGGWQPQERLGREQAVAAQSAQAALAGFAEGRFGRLMEGERADFIVLDRDPLLATPAELRMARIVETWIAGRKIYDSAAAAPAATGPGQSLKVPAEAREPAAPAPARSPGPAGPDGPGVR